eukprot:1178467-Prorocentrum_minimum.AAC.1
MNAHPVAVLHEWYAARQARLDLVVRPIEQDSSSPRAAGACSPAGPADDQSTSVVGECTAMSSTSEPPPQLYVCSVVVDGEVVAEGRGYSSREARKAACVCALQGIHAAKGLQYKDAL